MCLNPVSEFFKKYKEAWFVEFSLNGISYVMWVGLKGSSLRISWKVVHHCFCLNIIIWKVQRETFLLKSKRGFCIKRNSNFYQNVTCNIM